MEDDIIISQKEDVEVLVGCHVVVRMKVPLRFYPLPSLWLEY